MNNEYKIISKFLNTCEENNLYYTLDSYTILSYKEQQNNKKHDFRVPKVCFAITINTFNKLINIIPENLYFKGFKNNKKPNNLKIYFKENDFTFEELFIELRLIIPTTFKKVKKFYGLKNRIKAIVFSKSNNVRNAIDFLYSNNNDGYLFLENKLNQMNWLNTIDFETTVIKYMGMDFPVFNNYENILSSWFENQHNSYNLFMDYYYPNPLLKIKREEKYEK